MSDIQSELQKVYGLMRQDPEYAALSYEDQKIARMRITQGILQKDSEFQGLPVEEQAVAVDRIVSSQRPVFENVQMRPQLEETLQKIESGEINANETSAIGALNGLIGNTVIANLVARPAVKAADALMGATSDERMFSWQNLLRSRTGSDGDKLMSYMNEKLIEQGQRKVAGSARTGQAFGSIMGFVGDLAVFHGAWAKMAAAPMKEAGLAIAKRVPGKLGTYAGRTVLPAAVSGTSSGVYGIFREQFLSMMNDDESRAQDSIKKVAKTFGTWAALDFAANMAFGTLLPHLGGSWRRMFGKAKRAKEPTSFTPQQTDELIEAVTEGRAPKQLMDQLDPATRRFVYGQADLRIAAKRVDGKLRLRPYDDLAINANSAGATVYRDPSTGKTFVYKASKDGKMVEELAFDDIIGAKREVSRELRKRAAELSGEAKQEFLRQHKTMLQYSIAEDMIDGAYDPKKIKGAVGPKEAEILKPKKGARSKDFISPVDRPYVGANEAERLEKAFGKAGYVKRVNVDIQEETLTTISKGQMPYSKGNGIKLFPQEEGAKVLAFVRRPATDEAIEQASMFARKAKAQGSSEPLEMLRNMYLMESGFDGLVDRAGNVHMFYPDKLKLVAMKFDPYTGKIGNITSAPSAEPSIRNTIERSYRGTVSGKSVAQSEELITQAASKLKGDLDVNEVSKLSKMVLGNAGVNPSKIKVKVGKYVNRLDDFEDSMAYAKINKESGTVTIEVPRRISTPKAQKQFITELFEEEYDNVIKTLGNADEAKAFVYPKLGKSTQSVFSSPFDSPKTTENWLRSAVEDISGGKFYKTAKGYSVKLPGKEPFAASSLDELTDRIMVETMDGEYLRFDMARRGYKLTKKGGTYTVRGKGLDKPVTGGNINQIMDKLNYRPEKISNVFAPKVTILDEASAEVSFTEGTALGSKQSIKKMLSKFEDMDHMARKKHIARYEDGEVLLSPAGEYEVHMPEYGIIKSFSKKVDAERFVRKTWKDYDSLKDIVHRKGLQMWHEGGVTKISDGSATHVAKSREDIFRILKEYPDTTGGKEILDLPPEEMNAIDEALFYFNKADIPVQDGPPVRPLGSIDDVQGEAMLKEQGLFGELRSVVDNTDHWAEVTFKKMGADDLLDKYRNVETARRIAQTEIQKAERALRAIFTKSDGSIVSGDRARAIFYHSGAQTNEEIMHAYKTFGELSTEERAIAANLRKLLGEKKGEVLTGLAGKFGVDPNKFITNYMPRIMDWAVKNTNRVASMTSAEELVEAALRNVHGTSAPKQLKAFFKNRRVADALEFAAIDDPVKALQHYIRTGYKQMYMGRAWEELQNTMVKSGVGEGVVWRLNRYREILMGIHTTEGAKVAKRIGAELGKKLGIDGGEHMMNAYFSLNYFANMGYRPWLALRNTYQVLTTLAPRMGNSWVSEAIRRVNKISDKQYEFLQTVGVIPDQPPIVNTILDADSFVGKATHRALGMFKSSDEYTRAVGYYTAASRFDFAMDKWAKGGIRNIDEFLSEAGVTKMDDETIRTVRRLVEEGSEDSINAARTRFGTQLSEESFFGYRQSQAPALHTGSYWGKMFGQYGTYSAGYRAMISRGLRNGNVGDKVAFVSRFLGNQAALYAAFRALKIDGRNFIPGAPALFGGGPQFEVAVAIAESMSPTYRGKQAQAKLGRKFSPIRHSKEEGLFLNYPEMLPGSIQLRYAKKSLEYLQDDDYWRAFLAATTTPVVDPPEGP